MWKKEDKDGVGEKKEGGCVVGKKLRKKRSILLNLDWKYQKELKWLLREKVDFWGEIEMPILSLEHFILPDSKDTSGDF